MIATSLKRAMWIAGLPFYALWLLILCCFEDTTQWAEERLLVLKRSFAVVMITLITVSVFFCAKALAFEGESQQDRRMDRVERRLDYQVDKAVEIHQEIFQRLQKVEADTKNMDRLVYGVIGQTVAVLGLLLLQLFKLKIVPSGR